MDLEVIYPPSYLHNTLGAHLLGTFLSAMQVSSFILYGVVLLQAYRYFRLYPTDSLLIRTLVSIVLAIATFHTIITIHSSYNLLVSNHAAPVILTIWSFSYTPAIVVAATMLISQLFFVRRVFLSMRPVSVPCMDLYSIFVTVGRLHRFIAVVAMLLYVSEIGIGIAALVKALAFKSLQAFNDLVAVTFVTAVVGDLLLTTALIKVLYSSRNRPYTCSPDTTMVDTVTAYTINTGLLHGCVNIYQDRSCNSFLWIRDYSLLNITSVCLAMALPLTFWAGAVSHVTTKAVYAITLLTVLNTRSPSLSQGIHVFDGGQQYGKNIFERADSIFAKELWNVPQLPDSTPEIISINVWTEMETEPEFGVAHEGEPWSRRRSRTGSVNGRWCDSVLYSKS
ncbi:hypothetical protein C8Q74DRAFT_1437121 [Fomes fomentarius]|nr:hypothetical protein C8Q74DRAFT_1437121 [Fomes fomentarius]